MKRFRPAWHRVVGVALLIAGFGIAVLNVAMQLSRDLTLLPGGHSTLYLMAGLVVAGYGTWWLGWYDRPTIQQR